MTVRLNALHALRAAERTNGGSGRLPEVFDEPEVTWWQRLFKWERLTMPNRTIEKGWVVPQPLGVALILVMISGAAAMYTRMDSKISSQNEVLQTQKELIIRLDQRLIDKNDHDQEKFEEMNKRFQNVDAVQTVLGRDLVKLQAQRGRP